MPDLDAICATGLRLAFSPAEQVFDRQLRDGSWAMTGAEETVSGSLICLIAVDRAEVEVPGLQPRAALDGLLGRLAERGQLGALGLAIWAAAVLDGPPPAEILAAAGAGDDSAQLATRLTTMELAWLVSGLLHDQHRRPSSEPQAGRRLRAALDELAARRAPSGLMRHAGRGARLAARLRGDVANFADQVYAIQAYALAAAAGLAEGRPRALALAEAVAVRQGPLGQWWWHYGAERGTIASRYPVYAVHQHGMAPMAFGALAAVTGDERWVEIARRGRRWLTDNELAATLVDESVPTIWRSIERREPRPRRWLRRAAYVLGSATDGDEQPALVLNRETRPYEWAWQLYASAQAGARPRRAHIL